MALKVWLPLSGDTTNYGLSDATIEATPGVQYGNGILGGRSLSTANESLVHGSFSATFTKFSISAWVKEGVNSTGATILAIQNGTTDVLTLSKGDSGYIISALTSEVLFTSLTAGWNHIAVTADGTTVKAYLNGALVKETTQTGTITTASTYRLTVGGKFVSEQIVGEVLTRTFSSVWNGSVNSVKIYDSVLSLFEVINEANGLVLNYSFNGKVSLGTGVTLPAGTTADVFGFGDKEYDLSGNGYDGTFGEVKPTSSNDTAMYSSSMDFSSSIITSANIITNEFSTRYTISVWVKGAGTFLTIGNWAALSATDAYNWRHIVITSAGKKFVDGIESGAPTGSLPSGTVAIVIGAGFSGNLSDLRIYAKEMSATEVASLFARKAAIDNTGKLAAAEFIVNNNKITPTNIISTTSFSEKGVISVADIANCTGDGDQTPLVDITKFALYQSGILEATDVIEI